MNAFPVSPVPKAPVPFLKSIAAGVVVLNLLVIGATARSLYESRNQYDERAAATARNLVHVLDQYVDGVVDKADLALVALGDQLREVRGTAGVKELGHFIAHQQSRQPGLDGLGVAAADGRIVSRAGTDSAVPDTVAQQDFFLRLRADPSAGVVFSKPLPRAGGGWSIVLARPLERPDGRFAGLVYASIAIEQFQKMFSSLDIGKRGSVTLRDEEHGIVTRYPDTGRGGSSVGNKRVSETFRRLVASGQNAGTYVAYSSFDDIERVFSYRKIAHHPLYVIVGIAKEDYLAPWRGELAERIAHVALFLVGTVLWALLLHHVWMRKAFSVRLEQEVQARTAELRALAVELTMVEERERNAIAQDLHDDLGQTLAIAKLKLTAVDTPGKSMPECQYHKGMMAQINEVEAMINEANRSVRSLSRQLTPPVLQQLGLVPALEWLAEEMQEAYRLHVRVHDDGDPKPLDQASANMLFRAVRELLINVHKHAGSRSADVSASVIGGYLMISVTDNGVGFDAGNKIALRAGGGFGLFSISERLRHFGGEMQIDSGEGDGTVVVLMLPLATRTGEGAKNDTAAAGG